MLRGGFNYSYGNIFYNLNMCYYHKYQWAYGLKKSCNLKNYRWHTKKLTVSVCWQEGFLNLYSYLSLTNTSLAAITKVLKKQQLLVFSDNLN